MRRTLQIIYEYLAMYLGLGFLGLLCLAWLPFALVLRPLLPRRIGGALGRFVIMVGFRVYIRALALMGACRFDLSELDALRGQQPMIIAPNHPCLLDAVMVISRLRDVVCIMKSGLTDNVLLGSATRLARYIRNDSPLKMVMGAVEALRNGSHLLVFPEGTRTTCQPVNSFKASVGLIARRARVPVQTVFIETNSPYLSKGWPLFRRPSMPIEYRVRLGRRFEAGEDNKALMRDLEQYFQSELRDGAFPLVYEARGPVTART